MVGCSGANAPPAAEAVGGTSAKGGTRAAGDETGDVTVGGSAKTAGGAKAASGTRSNGGSSGSDGASSSGGTATVTDPRTAAGSGGLARVTVATDGTLNAGGSKAAGGSFPAGGNAQSGGSKATGTVSAGGTASSGGANPTSGALIRNDVFWKDTSGNPIYSQGGGVLKVGTTYYWYGVKYNGAVSYAGNPKSSNSDTGFLAVTIYSSTDLATWRFENNALTAASLTAAGADPSNWIGRVGAAYNATTKKYVLNGQYGGTPNTTQFFATSDTPNGPFKWEHTQATISNVTNDNCGDQSIFNDDDGQAYLVCSSQSGRSNLYVAPLRAADFLSVEPATRVFGGAGREGNAMFKYGGRYYLCSSDLHGWNASHSYYVSATNILGPYGAEGIIGNTDADFSHVTQTGLFVTVSGSVQSTVIFGGDRWSDFAGNGIGYNQWVPLIFNGAMPVMESLSEWSIDAVTGTWSVGPGNNYALNPSFEADRVAVTVPAGWSSSNGSNVSGGHTGRWAWQLSGTSSLAQSLARLPNGTYALSAWIKSNTAGAQLYAKGSGGTDKTATLAAASSWTNLAITGIAVSNGECEIGVKGSGQTVSVDDLALTRQ